MRSSSSGSKRGAQRSGSGALDPAPLLRTPDGDRGAAGASGCSGRSVGRGRGACSEVWQPPSREASGDRAGSGPAGRRT